METSCECPEPTVIPIISHSETLSYTSRTSTCIIQGSIKEVFITVTSVVTTSIVTTSTVTTSTVMETPVQFADQKSDNCQKELTSAIVVPVIIILILIVLTVTILIVYVIRKGKRYVMSINA